MCVKNLLIRLAGRYINYNTALICSYADQTQSSSHAQDPVDNSDEVYHSSDESDSGEEEEGEGGEGGEQRNGQGNSDEEEHVSLRRLSYGVIAV